MVKRQYYRVAHLRNPRSSAENNAPRPSPVAGRFVVSYLRSAGYSVFASSRVTSAAIPPA